MTPPRVYKTEAVILGRIDLGEADRILTLYSPTVGKFRVVAKGARRPKSKLGGHLELLTHSALMLARGQNLDIVTQAQTIESFLPLRDDLWRASTAIYAAELVNQFTPENMENYPVFQLLLETLRRVCQSQDVELPLRYFEINLLTDLGYKPELYYCLGCKAQLEPRTNFFSANQGGVLCPECRRKDSSARSISLNALKVMRFFQKNDYPTASRLKLTSELSQELEQLTRYYIRCLLEREVKSVEWLDRLRREANDHLRRATT